MASRNCIFNKKWLLTYSWLVDHEDKRKAMCKHCKKVIDIASMGEAALKSHAKSEKHKKSTGPIGNSSMDLFTVPPPPPTQVASSATNNNVHTVNSFINKETVLRSEIIWTLKTVVSHCSYKSNENVNDVFKAMFPDSEIAKRFQCGERKTAYMCVFGLAEHFKEIVLKEIEGHFVLLFDESLNKKMQEKQLDIHVRYWDSMSQAVVTRYLGSQFMGHATAEDLVQSIKLEVTDHLNVQDLLQISMDGPTVNFKLLKIFQDEVSSDYGHNLIDIGSCGLHTLHNSFKSGVSKAEWDISSVLRSLYTLFKDAPARREDYLSCAGTQKLLPLKFVDHRWLENAPVCRRAITIWPFVKQYVRKVQEKTFQKPSCSSYDVISNAVKDNLIIAKLEFFNLVADILQPFLKNFQSEKPLVPFLSSELSAIVRSLMRRFVKPELLDAADTTNKLSRLDVEDKENHVSPKKVEIGLAAEAQLKDIKASEKQVFEFRNQCKQFLIGLLKKMLEKSPLKSSLVRFLSCLDPRVMVRDKNRCLLNMKNVLKYFVSLNRLNHENAEKLLEQFSTFVDRIPAMGTERFEQYKPFCSSLDLFFKETMLDYTDLFQFVKLILMLSHGQANVERGFSTNKEIEVENLSHRSLTAQRIVCDYVYKAGGVLNVPVTNKMMVAAASARQKYEAYLESEREKKKSAEQTRKRKSTLEEIEEAKKKKIQIERDIQHLEKNADDLSEKAETTGKLQFLSEANCNRRRAKEKKVVLNQIVQKIDEKLNSLRNN